MTCDRVRPDLGAYVLGLLDDDEFDRTQAHLDRCPDCQVEADALAAVPELLGKLTAEEADAALAGPARTTAAGPDPALLDRLLAAVATETRATDQDRTDKRRATVTKRRWRRIAVAAAVVAILGGGAAAAGVLHDQGSTTKTVAGRTLTATDPTTGVGMDVTAKATSWGTALSVQLTGVPRGERCLLYVVTADGARTQVASWEATYGGPVDVDATTSVPAVKVASFVVTTVGGDHLVTVQAG